MLGALSKANVTCPYCTTTTQLLRHYCTITAPLRYCVTASLRHCATAPLRHCATAPLRHCVTAPLRHCATMSLRHKHMQPCLCTFVSSLLLLTITRHGRSSHTYTRHMLICRFDNNMPLTTTTSSISYVTRPVLDRAPV